MPPKIVDAAVRVEQGSKVPCSATGTPPIYIALVRNFTVLMNKTDTASSKLYQESNYTCVATSKYGTDEKHFVIKEGEKIRYFETNTIHTELRLRIWHIIIVSHYRRKGGIRGGQNPFPRMRPNIVNSCEVSLEAICNDMLTHVIAFLQHFLDRCHKHRFGGFFSRFH